MKCVKLLDGKIDRVPDWRAEDLVKEGLAVYIAKSAWKRLVRDPKQRAQEKLEHEARRRYEEKLLKSQEAEKPVRKKIVQDQARSKRRRASGVENKKIKVAVRNKKEAVK